MNMERLKRALSDIRTWILFFFLIRLVGITHAPLEAAHNWRQALTNMVARNFLEIDSNILFPRIDMAGDLTGIIGSEFPFYNYLIYLVSSAFGYSHWYGRLINLVVTSLGTYYFYKLVKDFVNQRVAFNATLLLSVSIWFVFGRKIMPDTFSTALVITGLYFAWKYIQKGKWQALLLFFSLSTLGMLCKIPALSLFTVLGLLVVARHVEWRRKLPVLAAAGLGFLIVCSWYFYWVPLLLEAYRYQLYFPKGFMEGAKEIMPLISELLDKFYYSALHSYVAFAAVLGGIYLLFQKQYRWLAWGILLITGVFFAFILKTGAVFPLHGYYVIPYTPIMAIMAGLALSHLKPRYELILLAVISIESVANQQHDFFLRDSKRYKLELEATLAEHIPGDDLIIINGGASPQDMYFAHRKGWTRNSEDLLNPEMMTELIHRGAQYLVIDKHNFEHEFEHYEEVFSSEHYGIYHLNSKSTQNPTNQ